MSGITLLPNEVAAFQNSIWSFYRENKRDFAWRGISDPYAILVSEMMLQQTQTLRVIPKYAEWMRAFPTAQALAEAPLSTVLAHWNGLGYNRRAVFLQNACKEVCNNYGGVFPKTQAELQSLPGIGPYTAGAVATFAYNQPNVFIETNIRSVYIHTFFEATDSAVTAANGTAVSPATTSAFAAGGKIDDKDIAALVEQTLDKTNPREWYYALMDYGAALKKQTVNPSRRSRQYTKQSRFEGSLRQARGAILRQLAQTSAATLPQIAKYENIDIARLQKAADKLVAESLITAQAGLYRIAD